MTKFAVLGYNTINIGDDVQSFITSTLLDVDYIIMRDDYDIVYNFKTGEKCILNENVFLIMNGWFMHNSDWKTGNNNIKFPIKNKFITPIYISTCLSKDVPLLFKPECIDHYNKHSPILCRDNTTLEILKKKGVNSSFFGCITQLLDFDKVPNNEEYKDIYNNSVIYIDCKNLYNRRDKNEKAFYFEHYDNNLMKLNPKQRIDVAINLYSKYKYASKIYSARLHAFLPCRAMGLNVTYVGDINYRVKDLVTKHPDKENIRNRFFKYIEEKTL